MNVWVVSTSGLLRIVLLWTLVYRFFCGPVISFLLGLCLGVELLDVVGSRVVPAQREEMRTQKGVLREMFKVCALEL